MINLKKARTISEIRNMLFDDMTAADVAELLNVTRSTGWRKKNGVINLTRKDRLLIIQKYQLDNEDAFKLLKA